MPKTPVDTEGDTPGSAQRRLGARTNWKTTDRAQALHRLQENANAFLDFDVLADRERAGL